MKIASFTPVKRKGNNALATPGLDKKGMQLVLGVECIKPNSLLISGMHQAQLPLDQWNASSPTPS
jgi:hypothetical protein